MSRKTRIPKDGKPLPASTRLKLLSPDDRRAIAALEKTLASSAIRAAISQKHGINLSSDSQLTRFFAWQRRQEVLDKFSENLEQDEAFLSDQFPTKTREELREMALKRGYVTALASDDPQLAMLVTRTDLMASKNTLEWHQYRRETCEMFIKWAQDKRAMDIANAASTSNADKIEQLGQLMFGEDWKK